MVAAPSLLPITTPVAELMPAMLVLLLVQTPLAAVLPNVVVAFTHTAPAPVMADGAVFTVITFVTIQPVDGVKVMVTTPADMPVTIPLDAPTLAVLNDPLLHAPVAELVRVVVLPTHNPAVPLIAGAAFTVNVLVTVQLPSA